MHVLPLLAGVDSAARARVAWGALPQGVVGLAAVALAALVVWAVVAFYRREEASRARGLRWLCAGLRLACMAALAVVVMQPFVVREVERLVPGRTVVLVDRSASMSVRDTALPAAEAVAWADALGLEGGSAVAGLTRSELARRVLERNGAALLRECARRNVVELRTFAGGSARVLDLPLALAGRAAGATPIVLPEWSPDDPATDLAGAIRGALDEVSEGRLAGILVLTDGRDTKGGDVAHAAALAARQGVPVDFVAIGASVAPPNVAVTDLSAREHAVIGLPMRMEASVVADGFAGRTATLVLTADDGAGGPSREVLRRTVTLGVDGVRQTVDLTHTPAEGGRVRYTARIEPLPGESRDQDNAARREVLVSDRKIAVLLAAGGPSIEFRFLSSMLRRDPLFTVTVWTPELGGGAGPPAADAVLGYDVVALCDPPPAWAGDDWLGSLAQCVEEEGLGFAFVAGPTWTPELLNGPDMDALRALLPVVPESARVRAMVGRSGPYSVPCPVELDEAGGRHPILSVTADPTAFWSSVPPVYWMLPAARPKPGATVLLRCREAGATRPEPLVAVQPYGLGRVFYCGTPEAWRWRRLGIGEYERFWLQALRYCAAGRLNGDDGARILLERNEYAEGEAVRVRLRLPSGGSAEGITVSAESGGNVVGRLALRPAPDAEGLLGGFFYPPAAGRYELTCVTADGARTVESITVGRPDAEFEDLRADYAAMRRVAEGTGGRCFGPAELGDVPAAIPSAGRRVVDSAPPDPLWDAPVLMALLIGGLAVEWLLRKWMGLL
jgi:hypothetical protein